MARTNATLVGEIVTIPTGTSATPFINAANELVTEICADEDIGYTSSRLEMIETWLAAHFLTILVPRRIIQQVDVIRTHYSSKVGLGLDLTWYGQQVKLLDTNGGLALLDNSLKDATGPVAAGRKRGRVVWLGKPDPVEG